jgi:hypothetical protein
MFTRDLLERVLRTFVAAVASAWLVTGEFSEAALLAAVSAGVTAVIGLIAKNFGDPDTASFRK